MKAEEMQAGKMYELLESSGLWTKGTKLKADGEGKGENLKLIVGKTGMIAMKTTNGGARWIHPRFLKAA